MALFRLFMKNARHPRVSWENTLEAVRVVVQAVRNPTWRGADAS